MRTDETHLGELLDAITTVDDADAHDQLMYRTGIFLNMLDHCARFHRGVLTAEYLGEVLGDFDHIQLKFGLPQPKHPDFH